ncbi:calcium-binding protein [Jannaschia seohaensis]|uniref:Hemolysin type calcium-binding protein n=1 Tax=Jannaschia seohaensis TaxID=475081 RepID=A0A2Y9A0N9_9RHOB|nr:calcium-binding protein [Jannaschia seohaensis]PWJ21823.1 hypothetical protein BCF38_101231 [Jannaschia seohaensis]SSA38101.1 hypothetical protein SAMN05421539_101231 [Jannaschia seohaensis]
MRPGACRSRRWAPTWTAWTRSRGRRVSIALTGAVTEDPLAPPSGDPLGRLNLIDPETGALREGADIVPVASSLVTLGAPDVEILTDGRVATAFVVTEAGQGSGPWMQVDIHAPDLSSVETQIARLPEQALPRVYLDGLEGGGYAATYDLLFEGDEGDFVRDYVSVAEVFNRNGLSIGAREFEWTDPDPADFVISGTADDLAIFEDGTILGRGALPGFGGETDRPAIIEGGPRGRRIEGSTADDTIDGGGGDDTVRGSYGDDDLDGGTGADELRGGVGDDRYLLDDPGDVVIEEAGEGRDEVFTFVDLAAPEHVERVKIVGGERNVRLEGSAGDDWLEGNRLANTLVASEGQDTLVGRGGGDDFVLTADSGRTVIADFEAGDRLLIDDRLLGLGDAEDDPRVLDRNTFRNLREAERAGFDAGRGEVKIDIDGDGVREVVAVLQGDGRPGLDDVLLF